MKINRKLRRMFNLYNIAILVCILVILISLYIIFVPEKTTTAEKETNQTKTEEVVQTKGNKEISEKEARKIAVKQFKKLGEKIKEDELELMEIQRNGNQYYYITSSENSLEIRIENGKIERLNSEIVEQ